MEIALFRRIARRFGFDIVRAYDSPTARRMRFLERYQINLMFDVGANVGQFGITMRQMGYRGEIVSFEPLSATFAKLKETAANDTHWQVVNAAIGQSQGTEKINVSANDSFSSLLNIRPFTTNVNRSSHVVNHEEIKIERLDGVFARYYKAGDRVLVKADTQGYEAHVVRSAERVPDKIQGFLLELSLVPLYEGEMLLGEMVLFMQERGYTLVSLEPVYTDPKTGQMLQVDGLFFRL